MILHVYTSDDVWLRAASEFIFSGLSEAREVRNAREAPQRSLHLCLAGGATPKPIYEALVRDPRSVEISDARSIHLWVGDEREAEPGSGFRNSEMIAAAFKYSPTAFVLHQWPPGRRALAARTYEEELSTFASERVRANQPIFDLTILGMGEDGHTAGLFSLDDFQSPADSLKRATILPNSLVMLTEAPQEPKSRMTLAPEILRSSRRILVLMQGLTKVRVLIANLVGEREDPIKHFLNETCEVIARI
jgi:6-phosphogluconolactonase